MSYNIVYIFSMNGHTCILFIHFNFHQLVLTFLDSIWMLSQILIFVSYTLLQISEVLEVLLFTSTNFKKRVVDSL